MSENQPIVTPRLVEQFVKPFRVLSLGAGVQSSTMAMMMAHGEIEKADLVVFADTCAEPAAVYKWLGWLVPRIKMPFVQVMAGEGYTAAIEAACAGKTNRLSTPPLFTANGGRIHRQCTWDYKVTPIRREIRRFCKQAVMVRGISFDERHRAKPCTDVKWITHDHPLVDLQISRYDCLRWMNEHGYPLPPRSACVYCPNRCNSEWQKMRNTAPEDFAEACRIDDLIRNKIPGMKEEVFLHRQCVPLRDADLTIGTDPDQLTFVGNGWADCDGMCGA